MVLLQESGLPHEAAIIRQLLGFHEYKCALTHTSGTLVLGFGQARSPYGHLPCSGPAGRSYMVAEAAQEGEGGNYRASRG